MSASEKEENKAKELALKKERDEFATLALERGKALEVKSVVILLKRLEAALWCIRLYGVRQ